MFHDPIPAPMAPGCMRTPRWRSLSQSGATVVPTRARCGGTGLGGLIGIALGFATAFNVTALVSGMPQASVPLWAVFAAAGFSALVGVVFGIMSASKAAGLDPIEALRYE